MKIWQKVANNPYAKISEKRKNVISHLKTRSRWRERRGGVLGSKAHALKKQYTTKNNETFKSLKIKFWCV